MKAKFITFEGIEGCGKSTQIKRFAEYLRKKGCGVLLTREPGGTGIGDHIRQMLLNPQNTEMAPVTELLLYGAARAQHVEEKILPAIQKGEIVISDRYADATTAYQGAARSISRSTLRQIHEVATSNLMPDITFLLDLPAEVGLARAKKRNVVAGHEDRFENEEMKFHEKVRNGYLAIAKAEPNRVITIDARGTIEEVSSKIIEEFEKRHQI